MYNYRMIYFNNLHVHLQLREKFGLWRPDCWTPCASLATHLSPFSVQTLKYSNVLFFFRYITELIAFPLPLNRKKRKKTGSWSCSVGVANVRAITDQIFPGLKKMLSILLGFRKHVRYVACMRARKLSLDSERLFVLSPGQIIYQHLWCLFSSR